MRPRHVGERFTKSVPGLDVAGRVLRSGVDHVATMARGTDNLAQMIRGRLSR